MRIGFEAKRATHNFRGLGNYSRGLIEGLVQYYPTEELLLYTPPINDPRGLEWANSLKGKVSLKYPSTLLESTFSSLWRSFLLASDLKKENLDIFHGLSHEIPFRLKGSMPYKKIVTIHDLIFLRYPEFFSLVDRTVYLQKFKYATENSDVVIAICEQTREDLIKYLKVPEKKIAIHYQSCSPNFYQKCETKKIEIIKEKYNLAKPYILHVGAFEENKNQLTLLQAYATIANQISEDLIFVGQGKKYKEKVENLIVELGLNHRVHILNSVQYLELPALYQAASVFCFPSLFEGFGIPILEALFSGIPVITTKGSCFLESGGPDSLFIDPLSYSSIAESLKNVLSDLALRNQMSTKGREYVERFHLSNSSAQLIDLYRRTLS